jgi:hypothetical protein
MALDSWRIRLVEQDDNKDLAKVLRNVLLEMGVPKVGTAYADPELDAIYESISLLIQIIGLFVMESRFLVVQELRHL